MKLLLKFNLAFLLVFVIGLAISGTVARDLLERDAKQEVVDRARLLMEQSGAVAQYTANQIAPLLQSQMKQTFLPQSVPQYSATQILDALKATYPEYNYKPAMLNPTSPRNRAQAWEADIVTQFINMPDLAEFIGERETPTGRSLYVALPIKLTNQACLQCHSTPSAAPATLIERYGANNGFGWTLNEAIGAQIVSVPMAVPLARADQALGVVMLMLTGVFLLMGVALNLLLWKLVIQPVSRLSALSDRVSLGELDAPEFETRSKDEIGVLAGSFARMRKSLVHAMKLLDS